MDDYEVQMQEFTKKSQMLTYHWEVLKKGSTFLGWA